MEKKLNENQIITSTTLVEVIIKPSKEVLYIVRGGNPQMPQTLFVGSPEEYCEYIRSLHVD